MCTLFSQGGRNPPNLVPELVWSPLSLAWLFQNNSEQLFRWWGGKKRNPRWGLKKHLHVKKRLKLHRYKVENNSNVVLWLKELVIGVVWSSLPNTFRAASLPSSSHINTLLSLTPRPTYCIIAWAGYRMERIGMFPFFFLVEHLEWMIDAGGARSERCNHGLTNPEP